MVDELKILKPCPFCGGNDLYIGNRFDGALLKAFVECAGCGATGSEVDLLLGCEEDAAEKWNRRFADELQA